MVVAIVLFLILFTLCCCQKSPTKGTGTFTEQLRSKWPFAATGEMLGERTEEYTVPPPPLFPISSMHKYINATSTAQSAIDHYAWSKVEPKHVIEDIAVFLLGTLKDTVQFGESSPDKVVGRALLHLSCPLSICTVPVAAYRSLFHTHFLLSA